MALGLRDLKRRLSKNACGNHMLLQKIQKQNKLSILAVGPERVQKAITYHIMLVSSASLRHPLRSLLLAMSVVPEHAPMSRIMRIDGLH